MLQAMPTLITYMVLVAACAGAVIHSLLTDPSSDGVLTPTIKSALGLAAVLIAAFLQAAPTVFRQEKIVRAARKARASAISGTGVLLLASCLHVPTPDGGSVTLTDAG